MSRNLGEMRPFSEVLMVVAHFLPETNQKDLYKIWKNTLYRAPELTGISWHELIKYVNAYLMKKYGAIYDKLDPTLFHNNDYTAVQILSGTINHKQYLPEEELPVICKLPDFLDTVKEKIREPVIHG